MEGGRVCTTEYIELQPLLSGVHLVMRVKSVLTGEGGVARPPPLITFTLTNKVAVYTPAEWADTLTQFHFYSYVLCGLHHRVHRSTDERKGVYLTSELELTPLLCT